MVSHGEVPESDINATITLRTLNKIVINAGLRQRNTGVTCLDFLKIVFFKKKYQLAPTAFECESLLQAFEDEHDSP